MPDSPFSNSPLVAAYRQATPGSARLAAEARQLLPSGIAHDGRHLDPYPIYVERAAGARKWDVDGNDYVDYFGGHGALLLGHSHPAVVEAVQRQAALGTHFGACHALEVEWAALIRRLMPAAERVRFTASGTEATLMALRLARAATGKPKLVRFIGHFHGWHDHMTSGHASHFDGTPTPGVLPEVAGNVRLAVGGDLDGLARLLDEHDDIAAIILEPTGGSWGRLPLTPDFVTGVRDLTRAHGVLLIFDEVITGFRVAPGGAQAALGIAPDLTTLAKIVAGGLPGGAVAGRTDLLDLLDFERTKAAGREKIAHPGTFNANPLSAAAGIATLTLIAETDACARANRYGAELRLALNRMLEEEGVPWAVYGTFSTFQLYTNPEGLDIRPTAFDPQAVPAATLKAHRDPGLPGRIRLGMLAHGVDLMTGPGGLISAEHGPDDLARTVDSLRRTVRVLRQLGDA